MKRLYRSYLISLIIIVTLFYSGVLPAQELSLEPVEFGADWFITRGPVVTGFDGPYAVVDFETVVSSPKAIAYYGILFPEDELAFPRYRRFNVESLPDGQSETTSHKIKMDISKIESAEYDMGIADTGGVVVYRIETFDPRDSEARIYEGLFRYYREGKSGTGKYSLLTAMIEGPFVDCVTDNSAIISWKTDQPSKGTVYITSEMPIFEKDESTKHEIHIKGLKPDRKYEYRIMYSKDGISTSYSFKTAPSPGSQRPFKFGFIADSRAGEGGGELASNSVNTKMLSQLISEIYYKDVEFICFPGDLGTGYTTHEDDILSQWMTWKRTIQPVGSRIPIYEGMGNHEQFGDYYKVPDPSEKGAFMLLFTGKQGEKSTEACFSREFVNPEGSVYGFPTPTSESKASGAGGAEFGPTYAENVYSFNYGNSHFVMLNTNYWYSGLKDGQGYSRKSADKEGNDIAFRLLGGNREGYIRDNQLRWLDQDLESTQNDNSIDNIFVMIHEPSFPLGGHVKDSMFWGTNTKGELGGLNDPKQVLGDVIDMRNRFLGIIAKYRKVTALLCGDEHNYSRMMIDSSLHNDIQKPLWQIISGGAGAPFYAQDKSVPWTNKVEKFSPSNNYCILTVDGRIVKLDVYSNTGQLIDHVEDLNTTK